MNGLLTGFEAWLRTLPPLGPPTPADGPDLATLLREFLALRQEINLLTRAARTQQEQNAATLQHLADAVAACQREPAADNGAAHLKGWLDVRDALGRAERELQKIRTGIEQALAALTEAEPALPPLPAVPTVSGWGRWFGVRVPDLKAWQDYAQAIETGRAARRERSEAAVARVRQIVASLVEGYTMSVQRLDRQLAAHDLEAIATEGQRFDPERMEALEAVPGTGRPAGEVVEEVRRGYLQRGRVLRFALVRVAREG